MNAKEFLNDLKQSNFELYSLIKIDGTSLYFENIDIVDCKICEETAKIVFIKNNLQCEINLNKLDKQNSFINHECKGLKSMIEISNRWNALGLIIDEDINLVFMEGNIVCLDKKTELKSDDIDINIK